VLLPEVAKVIQELLAKGEGDLGPAQFDRGRRRSLPPCRSDRASEAQQRLPDVLLPGRQGVGELAELEW
jgi:hypothetical protein